LKGDAAILAKLKPTRSIGYSKERSPLPIILFRLKVNTFRLSYQQLARSNSMKRFQGISIVAHRGNTATVERENTIEAFQKAIYVLRDCDASIGIPQIEFDVRITQDGHLISYHDATIAPDPDSPKVAIPIADLTYTQLQAIASRLGFEIPCLENILQLCRQRIALDIEIKEEGYEEAIVNLVTKYLNYQDFTIKSFNDRSIRKVKDLDPQIVTGLLLGKIRGRFPLLSILSEFFPEFRLLKTGADFVAPHFSMLKLGFLWRMNVLNKPVSIWTVNDERRLCKFIHRRYNIAGIVTDRPELALSILDREYRQNWQPIAPRHRLEN
jgi:glycerophosphoryl diester phosphodiesterase